LGWWGQAVRLAGSRDAGRPQWPEVGATQKLGLSGHPPVRMENTMATDRVLPKTSAGLIASCRRCLGKAPSYLVDDPEQLG